MSQGTDQDHLELPCVTIIGPKFSSLAASNALCLVYFSFALPTFFNHQDLPIFFCTFFFFFKQKEKKKKITQR
jgi:hypothetical protein